MADNINDSYDELKKTLESLGSPLDIILTAIGDMYDGADKLNNAFVQGRTRLDEMADSVAKSAAGVIRLGGDISDVNNTIIGIASGARRNVIATEEQVSKLYAAYAILGTTSKELVENFAEVGYETSQIGVNLENSIEYIQSVGLNAKEVMGDVQDNMSLMNKFNFTDGVVGLSKMAAQASMLRFDMSATAGFAEKVLTPEGAINTAAALQRLGVAVGQLGDPFALMNDAINDPGALQDSLIKATKQFTQFDEKTKSFKINPQGMLTLREMQDATGISYDQLAKSALAAADLDKRLSAISPSLDFETEEDKQFLANMATMSKDGDYVVKLKNDETGIIETKKLGEITQGEMEKLREQQENAPKTLEDIQKSQLNVLENIDATLKGNVAKGTFGVAGSAVVRGNLTGAERISRAVAGSVDNAVPESAAIIDTVNNSIEKMGALFLAKDSKKISSEDFAKQLESLENTILKDASGLGEKGLEAFKNIIKESSEKVTGNSGIEKEFRNFSKEILNATSKPISASDALKTKTQAKTVSLADVLGQRTESPTKSTNAKTNSGDSTTKSKVEFGDFKITIDTPPGTTLSQKQLNDIFNNEKFKQYITNLIKQGSGSGVVSY
jgi:hypothetical protein